MKAKPPQRVYKNWPAISEIQDNVVMTLLLTTRTGEKLDRLKKGWPECFSKTPPFPDGSSTKGWFEIIAAAAKILNQEFELAQENPTFDDSIAKIKERMQEACAALGIPVLAFGSDDPIDIEQMLRSVSPDETEWSNDMAIGKTMVYRDTRFVVVYASDEVLSLAPAEAFTFIK